MSRPRTITDRELLSAAKGVFLKQGVHAPVSSVARKLGVSVGALFFRMKSKRQLLLRSLLPPFPPLEVTLLAQEMPTQANALVRLRELLTGLCTFLQEALPGFFLLHTAGVLPMQKHSSETMDVVMRNALAAWLSRSQRRGFLLAARPAARADAIIGAMEARFLHAYLLKRSYSRAQNVAFIEGLLAAVVTVPPRQSGRSPEHG